MSDSSIAIIGDWRHADFSTAIDWLQATVACEYFGDLAAALAGLRSKARSRDPSGILLLHVRPGQFSEHDIERLHAAAPLARLVALLGPWCEGPARGSRPGPGVVRVPWQTWQTQLALELGLTGTDRRSTAPLPRTTTETERIEKNLAGRIGIKPFAATAVICTTSRTMFESVADALLQLGIQSHWHLADSLSPGVHVDVVIADGWDQIPPNQPAAMPPRLLLLQFPRPEDIDRANASGIAGILPQPLLLADLAQTLNRLLRHAPLSPDAAALTAAAYRN